MELALFNANYGYLEGIVRGYRCTFLTPMDYKKMKTAENLEDLRTILETTDYGSALFDEQGAITISMITKKCNEKLASDFAYLRQQSDGELALFLEFVALVCRQMRVMWRRREKMIDNLVALLQGVSNKKTPEELMDRIDPIGWFRGIETLIDADMCQSGEDLHRIILCDTPIGPYFERFLPSLAGSAKQSVLEPANISLLKSFLKKVWLEDFYYFSTSLGGTSAEVMGHILRTEADFRDLALTLNCVNLSQGSPVVQDRNKLYTSIGYLYPYGTERLTKAFNEATLQQALAPYPKYAKLYDSCKGALSRGDGRASKFDGTERSLEDHFYAESVKLCEESFEQQLHFGIFYAWLKLKQQEIRNITWIADMILLKRPEQFARVLPIFQPRVVWCDGWPKGCSGGHAGPQRAPVVLVPRHPLQRGHLLLQRVDLLQRLVELALQSQHQGLRGGVVGEDGLQGGDVGQLVVPGVVGRLVQQGLEEPVEVLLVHPDRFACVEAGGLGLEDPVEAFEGLRPASQTGLTGLPD
ncbi:vacuolar ATP synthase subunit d, putative [Babesia caballi]|uniref:Vacuolar ATP synthase subunit d, putative n=1 Tax=Babesia caballi TaxID=5871 RepID=A0AAV4LZZ4_BABCB|nr:vacuolar ATP synthase subunit d, putative [Babesia caballi]